MNYLIFDGSKSSDYGVYISGSGIFGAPERDVTKVSVPGRNGDIVLDNGRYKNMEIKYPAFIRADFPEKIAEFRNMLLAGTEYHRLEDSYNPDEYRMARPKGDIKTKPVIRALDKGTFDITFDCKPQRFLKSGETAVEFTAAGTITNLTGMTALPLIRAYGTGTLTIGGITVTIMAADGYTDIDCETQEAYKGSANRNAYITLNNGEFPHLAAGANSVSISGLTQVDITPRWWIL